MKIGILTQPLHVNYGGLLQNFALQQVLLAAGHEVETVDWNQSNSLHIKLSYVKQFLKALLFPQKNSFPRYRLKDCEKKVIQKNTDIFIQKYIRRTSVMLKKSDFSLQLKRENYDGFIVGSDQCWRPCYNSFLSAMFLDFTKKLQMKRIAYAASFGSDLWEFSPAETKFYATFVKKFDLVTVRENSAIKLCKDNFGIDAIPVLDPTMLLTKDDYIRIVELENEPESKGDLFYYILDPSKEKKDFIDLVAYELKLKAFRVLPKFQAESRTKENVRKNIEDCIYPRVTTWIRAFIDARMVITDSFHGAVFSILFNKPFWVIGNSERGLTRFASLLRQLNLEDRLLNVDKLKPTDLTSPINWKKVNDILEYNREKSKKLLLNSLL